MNEISLKNKNILITGASRGIGKAVALELSRAGSVVYLCGTNRNTLEDLAGIIKDKGGRAYCLTADFSDHDAVFSLAEKVRELVPVLDVLINNAGQALSASVEETSAQEWDRIMSINARSPYFLSQQLLPLMSSSTIKTIVNIASVVATEGYVRQSAYTASKHALIGFSKSMARELQDRGYKIHVISPGGVATDMVTGVRPDINTDELILPSEIADWILFLLTRRGRGMVDHIQIRRESKQAW